MLRTSLFSIALMMASSLHAQQGQIQVETNRWERGPLQVTQGAGVRVLKIVGQPIIENTTGKQLLFLVVDRDGRQVGAVIDSPPGVDHGLKITQWDGEIDSRFVTVAQWTIGRAVSDGNVGNIYGPEGKVRLVVGSSSNLIGSSHHYPSTSYAPPPRYQYSNNRTVNAIVGACSCR